MKQIAFWKHKSGYIWWGEVTSGDINCCNVIAAGTRAPLFSIKPTVIYPEDRAEDLIQILTLLGDLYEKAKKEMLKNHLETLWEELNIFIDEENEYNEQA